MKKLNPKLPMYIRPCDGISSFVAARYGKFIMITIRTHTHTKITNRKIIDGNVYATRTTEGKNAAQVEAAIKELQKYSTVANAGVKGGLGGRISQ